MKCLENIINIMKFKNKIVLITGASRGIGAETAKLFAKEGATVIINCRSDELAAKSVLNEINNNGMLIKADLSKQDEIDSMFEQVSEKYGKIDILVNNAGIVSGKSLLDLSDQEIERTFQVNTLALFWTVRAFLPSMLERGSGHIVTIASAASLAGAPKLTDYSSSKFAAFGFDESLRLELKQKDSRVATTIVCPFYIDTGMFDGVKTRFSWLLPVLKPEYVVRRIVTAIEKDRHRLVMPRLGYISGGFPIAPSS